MGRMGKGDWKKVQELKFYAYVTSLQASEGGVFSLLMSKITKPDTHMCQLEGQ